MAAGQRICEYMPDVSPLGMTMIEMARWKRDL